MYHEVTQPYGLLYNLIPALEPNARAGIVDGFAPTSEHGTSTPWVYGSRAWRAYT